MASLCARGAGDASQQYFSGQVQANILDGFYEHDAKYHYLATTTFYCVGNAARSVFRVHCAKKSPKLLTCPHHQCTTRFPVLLAYSKG
jgi:hypothetical protein